MKYIQVLAWRRLLTHTAKYSIKLAAIILSTAAHCWRNSHSPVCWFYFKFIVTKLKWAINRACFFSLCSYCFKPFVFLGLLTTVHPFTLNMWLEIILQQVSLPQEFTKKSIFLSVCAPSFGPHLLLPLRRVISKASTLENITTSGPFENL